MLTFVKISILPPLSLRVDKQLLIKVLGCFLGQLLLSKPPPQDTITAIFLRIALDQNIVALSSFPQQDSALPTAAMSLQDTYKRFLGSPNAAALSDDASLHYITTTTSVAGASDITKHLSTVASQVKKEKETVLYAIEGQDALALEVNTSLEFLITGGPYLPGLEDNYVADRKVNFTIVSYPNFPFSSFSQVLTLWLDSSTS